MSQVQFSPRCSFLSPTPPPFPLRPSPPRLSLLCSIIGLHDIIERLSRLSPLYGHATPWNRYSKGRTDIEHLGPHTKIVWNKAQPPLSKKLHDFCTLMHMEALEDGAFMLITRATEHPDVSLFPHVCCCFIVFSSRFRGVCWHPKLYQIFILKKTCTKTHVLLITPVLILARWRVLRPGPRNTDAS